MPKMWYVNDGGLRKCLEVEEVEGTEPTEELPVVVTITARAPNGALVHYGVSRELLEDLVWEAVLR
jgi:hypothetical protein